MKLSRNLTLFASALLCIATTSTLLQAQRYYYRRDMEPMRSSFNFTFKFLTGAEGAFSNVGAIDYPSLDDGSIDYVFNNGYVDAEDTGSRNTSNFSFEMGSAEYDANGYVKRFELNRFRAGAAEGSYGEDNSGAYGWDVSYEYKFGKDEDRLRFGVEVGGGIHQMNFDYKDTVQGTLYQQSAVVNLTQPQILYQNGRDYVGSPDGPSINLDTDFLFDPQIESVVSQPVFGAEDILIPSNVDVAYNTDNVLVPFHLGPTARLKLTERIRLKAGVGAMFTAINSRFEITETLTNSLLSQDYTTTNSDNQLDWAAGYYAEITVRYKANERTSIFASAQYMDLGEHEGTTVEDVEFQFKFDGIMAVNAGISTTF